MRRSILHSNRARRTRTQRESRLGDRTGQEKDHSWVVGGARAQENSHSRPYLDCRKVTKFAFTLNPVISTYIIK